MADLHGNHFQDFGFKGVCEVEGGLNGAPCQIAPRPRLEEGPRAWPELLRLARRRISRRRPVVCVD